VVPLRLRSAALAGLDEQALVALCVRRDRAAFDEFFHRYLIYVTRFLSRMLGPGHPDRDDLVQATFTAAADGIARFQGQSSVKTWLLGIATNLASSQLRRQSRHATAMAALKALPPAPVPTPEQRALRGQVLDHLCRALYALDPARRSAFLLCEVEGVPGAEAARILGVTQGSLYRQLSEARARLRAALRRGEEGTDA
jgi:RNA polymerase sigma-70 factor (ECF subfamily)